MNNNNNENTNYIDESEYLLPDESVIWKGKPNKKAFILNTIIRFLPFMIAWMLFAILAVYIILTSNTGTETVKNSLPIIIIMIPICLCVINTLMAPIKWKNTFYIITDKRIIICKGFVSSMYQNIYYSDISNLSLHIGLVDKLLNVGDIKLHLNLLSISNLMIMSNESSNNRLKLPRLYSIENPQKIYSILQSNVANKSQNQYLDLSLDLLKQDITNKFTK